MSLRPSRYIVVGLTILTQLALIAFPLSITAVWQQNGPLAVIGNDRISIVPNVEHTRFGSDSAVLTYNLTTASDGALTVRIDLRRSLPSRTFVERQGYGNESIVEYFNDECYYQGRVDGSPRSQVALSTCEGKVRGTVYDQDETYYIDYDEVSGEHFLERFVVYVLCIDMELTRDFITESTQARIVIE